MPNFTKLSILIPVYNEGSTIHLILDRIAEVQLINGIQKEVILVDDCSSDNTGESVKQYIAAHPEMDMRYFRHEKNQGKGGAIHTAIPMASGEYCIIQDADLEYDPDEYNNLIKPVLRGDADIVYGSRLLGGNAHRILFYWHSIGNRFLTMLSNVFTDFNLTDMETGYKLFRTSILQSLRLYEKGFGFEPEVTAAISKIPKIKVYETGISYYGRTYDEGKKINWRDGLHAIYCILKYNIFKTK